MSEWRERLPLSSEVSMHFERLTTQEQVDSLIDWHNRNSEYVVLDTETTGLNRFTDTIVSVQLTGKTPNSAIYFDGKHAERLARLQSPVVAHNFKFDFGMLRRIGIHPTLHSDTMLLHHLVDENAAHDLDSIVTERYGDTYKGDFWNKYTSFESAPEAEQLDYACRDVVYTGFLYRDLLAELRGQDSLIEHTNKLALALFETEQEGIGIDIDYLTALAIELKPKILQYRKEMRKAVEPYCLAVEHDLWAKQIDKAWKPKGKVWATLPKPEINFSSHSQVGALLYDKLGLPEQLQKDKKTKQWRRTVDDDALAKLEGRHAIVTMLRQYAEYQKVYTAFIEGTLERMQDGRIYPSFSVNGTVTGRISSSDPNLQQLPSKGDWAKVRGIYIPDPGYKIITCDYSQLEVVIAAHFSHDPNLLKIVLEGVSKHDITANSLGIPRSLAKTLNFAMQYQCSPRKVAQILGCSDAEATHAWNKYWETYALEKRVIDECKSKVDSGQPIINPFGRRRHFKSHYRSKWEREAAYRQAYSSLIQGTGADCTHYAFYTVAEQLKQRGRGTALFEVHDEIVISAKEEYCNQAKDLLQSTMKQAGVVAKLSVPLTTNISEPLARWEK